VRQLTIKLIGYQVVEASDAPKALDLLTNGNPVDLVFTDIVMPGGHVRPRGGGARPSAQARDQGAAYFWLRRGTGARGQLGAPVAVGTAQTLPSGRSRHGLAEIPTTSAV
jgi:CheY-like chemotaxis protein